MNPDDHDHDPHAGMALAAMAVLGIPLLIALGYFLFIHCS